MPRVVSTPSAGTAATVALAATPNVSYGVLNIVASYSSLTAVGTFTVVVGGVTVMNLDISGQGPFLIEEDLTADPGDGVVITLSGVLLTNAKLNVNYTANLS